MSSLVRFLAIGALVVAGASQASAHEAKTAHYTVWTDVSQDLAETVAQRMEGMFKAYGQVVGDLSAVAGVQFKVRIFARKADYESYVMKTHDFPGDRFRYIHYGVGSPKNEVLGWLIPDPALYARLQHEAFHQYFRRIVGKPPTWLNEGLAELLETSQITADGKLQVALNAPMHRRLREGIFKIDTGSLNKKGYRKIELRSLVRMPKRDWLAQEGSAYSQSWALVYFMLLEADRKWAGPLVEYINALQIDADEATNLKNAYKAAFSGVDFGQVYSGYSAWVKQTRLPGDADYRAGSKAFDAGDYAQAEQHLTRALAADGTNPRYLYLRGSARYSSSKLDAAQADLDAAIAQAPDDGVYFLTLGKIHVFQKNWGHAKWALEQAIELGAGKHVPRYMAKIPAGTSSRPRNFSGARAAAAPRAAPARSAGARTFKAGLAVAAMWTNGKWYTARITSVSGSSYSLRYDDGTKQSGVRASKLRHLSTLSEISPGDRVFAVWKKAQMYSAVVVSVSGSGCVVKWDDGSPRREIPVGKFFKR